MKSASGEKVTGSETEAPLLVVVGPTASGKTELALQLCEELGGEVVSADSVQVYRDFDIGSGKPTREELSRARHHLIDIAAPNDPLTAQLFVERAEAVLQELLERGVRPIVAGGTFLWVRALLYGLSPAPAADPEVRSEHLALAEREGRPALHARLAQVDPESAARLHPNDFIRVSRALEVFQLSGQMQSALHASHGFRELRRKAVLLGVGWEREAYDQRLRARTLSLFERGWVTEVRHLLERDYGDTRAMQAVGYRQVRDALLAAQLDVHQADTAELREEVYRVTRVFARRQRTWLREEPVHWLPPECLLRRELLRSELRARGLWPED